MDFENKEKSDEEKGQLFKNFLHPEPESRNYIDWKKSHKEKLIENEIPESDWKNVYNIEVPKLEKPNHIPVQKITEYKIWAYKNKGSISDLSDIEKINLFKGNK